jgi:hypothetical protein
MTKRLTPEDFQKNDSEFELLAEVSHQKLREFVVAQISEEKVLIRIYSIYQVLMMMLFVFIVTRSTIMAFKGQPLPLEIIGLTIIFSFSLLVIIHELLHAAAYLLTGARNISFGYNLRKFIFYALADKQVIGTKSFHVVALAPFVVVKLIGIMGAILVFKEPGMYFFLSVMCLHSLFCAGDMAMLAFYRLNHGKEIFNFDNRSEGKTYFYTRKK